MKIRPLHGTSRAIAALAFAAAGCSDGNAGSAANTPRTPELHEVRPQDRVSNGQVTVDEAGLHATVQDGNLELTIPISANRSGRGSLEAALLSVDGQQTLSQASVSFTLNAGARDQLHTTLALPADLKTQADRVRYSVRVRDKEGSTLQVTRSLLHVLPSYEVRLEGPAKLHAQKQASYRVRAEDPLSHSPVADAPVSLALQRDGQAVKTLSAQTDDTGSTVFEFAVEEPGDYSVAAQAVDQGTPVPLATNVSVDAPGQKLLVTTDKPLYQPGQTIHLRALALHNPDNQPITNADVTFEVQDAKGNKVLKKHKSTDDYGIASIDFTLASLVNMGTFKVSATANQVSGQKTVEVAHYVLPKFSIALGTDKPWYRPAENVAGTVDSRYFFGKAVNGASVLIEALTLDVGSNVFARVMGKTDDQGHFGFSLQLPSNLVGIPLQNGNALVTLRATLTDTAGQVVSKDAALTVASQALSISLVPEATSLVPGVENRLHLFATDPLGAPVADAAVDVASGPLDMQLRTDEFGYAEVRFVPDATGTPVVVNVTPKQGPAVQQAFNFAAQSGAEHVLLRTDKAVYSLGETVKVQVFASAGESHAYIDLQNDGQSVDMRTLELNKGAASFDLPLDVSLLGENRLDAYVVDKDGNSIRTGRSILVNREGGLQVSLEQDKPQYQPGETAQLTLTVKNQKGEATPAALGVQIVDEAVFGLIDAQPGLLRTFFELEDSFAKPSYELHAPLVNFDTLIFDQVASGTDQARGAAQRMAEAQLSALSGNHMLGVALASWPQTVADALKLLAPKLDDEKTRLAEQFKPLFKTATVSLNADGCAPSSYYCSKQQKPYLTVLVEQALGGSAANDFWGNAYSASVTENYPQQLQLLSRGPDERPATADDASVLIDFNALGLDAVVSAQKHGFAEDNAGLPQAAGAQPGFGVANAAAAPPVATTAPAGAAGPDQAAQPRVRSNFPETLYVNPALITDANGKVTVPVEMADSITSWRVSALANARSGELGGGQAGVTVFQDFFVDVNFPAQLTRGDQVSFPVVVYNYLQTPQTVRLELEQGAWFTAMGSTTQSLDLAPGEVRSVSVPVRVDRVGQQTLTVRAFGQSVSDAVARSVRVVPDGLSMPSAQSGSLPSGMTTLTSSFPSNAVQGSGVMYLDVYPAFVSQAVQGLDSMLRVPSGCFEQTTSTTWPNVLVTRYMQQTKQTTPEIALKAESLISAGYQRLLTFEHHTGGFSWFGDQDPKADISVTAFGLMEFGDMAKVQEVDDAMVARTQSWLVAQQTADGSWPGGMTEFFSFQTSAVRNTAFVVWALAQSGYSGPALQSGLDYVRKQISSKDDAYTVALVANAFAAVAPNDSELSTLFDQLQAQKHDQNGKTYWDSGATQTNFYGGGQDSAVATTALVAHAYLTANQAPALIKGALDYLTSAKDANGNFGSTQASVWALKTLLLSALKGTDGAVGKLDVSVDGQAFGSLTLEKDQWDVVTRMDMSQLASSGSHSVALSFAGSGEVSYNLVGGYNVPWAAMPLPAAGPLALSVSYDRTSLAVNDTVRATVKIGNLTSASQNMLLVTLGLPPGFDLLSEDLDNYIANGQLSRYEQTGKQIILYVTALPAKSNLAFSYRLRANMPVNAADGGARVQLYYQPNQQAQAASTLLVATGG
jgi:alpha-2-macroglobulin-like protein